MMEETTGLLLEGGAMRSVFSAGILDCLMDEQIQIPNVLAVSAGAYAGMNYVSGQRKRVIDAVIAPLREYKYLGFGTFLKKGTFFDMDYLFKEVPKTRSPYDFDKMKNYVGRFLTSTVNLLTGETVYFEKFKDVDEFFTICQAANSLPLIAKKTMIDGVPMLDGGAVDAIPIHKALEDGWGKIVVVLTRDITYRKKASGKLYNKILDLVYGKYPEFVKRTQMRHCTYNNALDQLAELESQGRAFVFRPTTLTVSSHECDVEKLMEYYQHGYDTATARMDELKHFLGICKI